MTRPATRTSRLRSRASAIPRAVWMLGLVSLCMDMSSELIHALLPLYLATTLGASALTIGIIEGVAEAIALVVKVFSGVISDYFRRRKPLVLFGYGLAALTKFVFPLAPTIEWVVTARFADRVGKGIRGAPRDALIADLTPPEVRGASFGLRQALDTVGAIAGPVLAILAMAVFAGDFRMAFWIAVVPAVAAVAVLALGVREPGDVHTARRGVKRLRLADAGRLSRAYWIVVAIATVLALARFSEAFLLLRATDVGMTIGAAPWVMVAMTIVYSATSYPAGVALDAGHGRLTLAGGFAALIAADLVLANAGGTTAVILGAALWGLHMGLTQGVLAAAVAATAPIDLRGSAFGVFNLASGVALLIASVLAGALWDLAGPSVTFYVGAAMAALAWIGFTLQGRSAR